MRIKTGLILLLCLAACLGCSKQKSTDELINDLKTGNEKDRIIAVRTLPRGEGNDEKVIAALTAALRDGGSDVRRSAAIRLGLYGDQAKDAIPELQKRLHDGDARVREAAGKALTRIDPDKFPTPPNAKSKT
jgi:HEAT repeat protein